MTLDKSMSQLCVTIFGKNLATSFWLAVLFLIFHEPSYTYFPHEKETFFIGHNFEYLEPCLVMAGWITKLTNFVPIYSNVCIIM